MTAPRKPRRRASAEPPTRAGPGVEAPGARSQTEDTEEPGFETRGDAEVAYRQLFAVVQDLQKVLRDRDAALHAAHTAERARAEFLASTSHGLLDPLTTILGYAEVCARDARTPQDRERLGRIVKAARELEGRVRQLLAIARAGP